MPTVRTTDGVRMLELAGPGGLPGVKPETAPLLRDHAQQDWRDVVARLDVPVLMVAGRHSQYWPGDATCRPQAAAARPRSRCCGSLRSFHRR